MRRDHVVLLEFNELCPSLLDRWMGEGMLPNFRRFFDDSDVFCAAADVTNLEHLEPWIQWYSLHTGLSYQEHGVFHLTSGPAAEHTDIWRMVISSGLSAGNCGSMNARAFDAPGSFYLPDPWCTSEAARPAELNIFHRFVSQHVQENSVQGTGALSAADYVRFVGFMAAHGLKMRTLTAIAKQLWSDTILRQGTAWRRVPLMDKLQFDLFEHYWRRYRPNLSSFFLNSTAHYQHAYWHCLFPEEFDRRPSEAERARFGNAILHGYRQMDELLGDFFRLEAEGARLILCTALSQQASGRSAACYYRAHDIVALLTRLGVRPRRVEPVMAQQYMAHFASENEARRARAALAALEVDGSAVFDVEAADGRDVFFGSGLRYEVAKGSVLRGLPGGTEMPFHDVFYLLPHVKSGKHHPDGVLWIKTGRHCRHAERVSILDIVPTLLDMFGIDRRRVNGASALKGRSLLPLLRGWSAAKAA